MKKLIVLISRLRDWIQNLLVITPLIAFLLAAYISNQNFSTAMDTALKILLGLFSLFSVSIWTALHLMRSDGLSRHEIYSIRSMFGKSFDDISRIMKGSPNVADGLMSFNQPRVVPQETGFARSESDIERISLLNTSAFRGPFSGSFESKFYRNMEMFQRNRRVFMCCINDAGLISRKGECLFFTCVLPLTPHGHKEYFYDRLYGDSEFDPLWIAKKGGVAESLLFFTMAANHRFTDRRNDRGIFAYLMQSSAFHIQYMLNRHFQNNRATIYVQNDSPAIGRLVKTVGFKPSALKSFDDEQVYATRGQLDFKPKRNSG